MKILNKSLVTALFKGETDSKTGIWYPIEKMTWTYRDGNYLDCVTVFTQGAKIFEEMYPEQPNIITFGSLDQVKRSDDIYSCSWANRMPVNRDPDPAMLEILGINDDLILFDPVEYIARSGGYKFGDKNDLFPEVQPDINGNYNFIFRTVDSYVFATKNRAELNCISVGEQVDLSLTEHRSELRCQNLIIGYAPRYIQELYKKYRDKLEITIFKVNSQSPYEYQFLCQAILNQREGKPFSELEYQSFEQK
jgi:hypothetical protein